MPSTALRLALLAAGVVIAIVALSVASAGGQSAVQSAIPQLQPPSSLPSVPHVPVPSVPSLPGTPSVPHTPSVPSSPSVPGVPSVRAPSVPGVGGGSSARGGGGAGGGSGASASSSGASGSSGGGARGSGRAGSGRGVSPRVRAARAKARREQVRERRAARERRLRATVTRFTGCLQLLPGVEGRFLALRAGLGSEPPHSRAAVASRLGISRRRAARTERRGLRRLRRTARAGGCGAGSSRARVAITGDTGPQLQPAVLMGPAPAALRSTADLAAGGGRLEGQGIKGADASSSGTLDGSSDPTPGAPAAVVANASDESTMTGWYVLIALMLALAVALAILLRRPRTRFEPVVANDAPALLPPPAAEPKPEPEPAVEPPSTRPAAVAMPPIPAHQLASRTMHRPSRRQSAAVVAGSLASLAATALLRRRRR